MSPPGSSSNSAQNDLALQLSSTAFKDDFKSSIRAKFIGVLDAVRNQGFCSSCKEVLRKSSDYVIKYGSYPEKFRPSEQHNRARILLVRPGTHECIVHPECLLCHILVQMSNALRHQIIEQNSHWLQETPCFKPSMITDDMWQTAYYFKCPLYGGWELGFSMWISEVMSCDITRYQAVFLGDFAEGSFFRLPKPESRRFLDRWQALSRDSFIKERLLSCERDVGHQPCRTITSFRPSRLLYAPIDAHNDTVFLREFKNSLPNKDPLPYLTLSHCWGQQTPLKLLKDNVESMKSGIKIRDLSKTFQDAITVMKILGVSFIWIDSLCIIQDSNEDWELESGSMRNVYSNSYCNIAATSAQDGSDGLFLDAPRTVQDTLVSMGGKLRPAFNNDLWEHSVLKSPLLKRAWVFQERYLSPRNLHFTRGQVFWECNWNSGSSESLPADDLLFLGPHLHDYSKIKLDVSRILHPTATRFDLSHNRMAFNTWQALVEKYSRCHLTQETDRLVAIGGLADLVKVTMGKTQYLAGLWERFLPYGLVWYPKVPAEKLPEIYVAPSWSWASNFYGGVDPGINLTINNLTRFDTIRLIDFHMELSSSSPFGPLKGGYITLQGALGITSMHIRTDTVIDDEMQRGPTYSFLNRLPQSGFQGISLNPDTLVDPKEIGSDQDEIEVYCLEILRPTDGSMPVFGLVLRLVDGEAAEMKFRRIGVYSVQEEVLDEPVCLRQWRKNLDKIQERCGLEYVEDGRGGFEYTVTII